MQIYTFPLLTQPNKTMHVRWLCITPSQNCPLVDTTTNQNSKPKLKSYSPQRPQMTMVKGRQVGLVQFGETIFNTKNIMNVGII